MLVLSRRPTESIILGEDIRVTVVLIRGGQVRLGIEAPPHVPIVREELLPPFLLQDSASADQAETAAALEDPERNGVLEWAGPLFGEDDVV